ncbi:syndecan-2 [Bombina bombina]|uniref:syndecan-2 n=1 Tax=Bombina bombina TaxID=8345 RepID=UPI00235A4922|nr:syndecan-2 [Bombina bombina]
MRNIWILLTFGLVGFMAGGTIAETQTDKDLYIDNTSEEGSGIYPIDDDDYSSGSGSGILVTDDEAEQTTVSMLPSSPTTNVTTTLKIQTKIPSETMDPENPEIIDPSFVEPDGGTQVKTGEEIEVHTAKHSENLFHRTEVLAAVIAGGGIGFLFAVFLILLLVYRMRKKDEGSYDLGERKPSSAIYQKAPTKEFYA